MNTTSGRTDLRYTGGALTSSIFTAQDGTFDSTDRATAIADWADGTGVQNGVYGYTQSRVDNNTQTGHALIGYSAFGGRSHLYLHGNRPNPQLDTYSHASGKLRMSNGDLWLCTGSGIPGTWRKLSGGNAAGSFHLLSAPRRAYDSRVSQGGTGPLTASTPETVDMTVSGLPNGITGVLVNLTIVVLHTGGFAVMWSNGVSMPVASSINFAAGQVLGNNVTTRVDSNRMAQIFSNSATEYVVDVLGYYQ